MRTPVPFLTGLGRRWAAGRTVRRPAGPLSGRAGRSLTPCPRMSLHRATPMRNGGDELVDVYGYDKEPRRRCNERVLGRWDKAG